jgi:hypothetical protein
MTLYTNILTFPQWQKTPIRQTSTGHDWKEYKGMMRLEDGERKRKVNRGSKFENNSSYY